MTESEQHKECSFCSKKSHEVGILVAGPPPVHICDECIDLCCEIAVERGYPPEEVKKASHIDLTELGFKPRFKTAKFERKKNHCFYLCPFSEPFDTIYRDHVRPPVRSLGYTIGRADDIFGTEPIIEDIWAEINSSSIIIADVSGRNPNVMYEIGMAHTVGKPVLIITQGINDVPFDLKHYRCIIYNYTPRGCRELEEKISGTLRFLKEKIG